MLTLSSKVAVNNLGFRFVKASSKTVVAFTRTRSVTPKVQPKFDHPVSFAVHISNSIIGHGPKDPFDEYCYNFTRFKTVHTKFHVGTP